MELVTSEFRPPHPPKIPSVHPCKNCGFVLCAIGEEKNEGLSLARDMKLENSIVEVRQQLIDSRSKTTINKGDDDCAISFGHCSMYQPIHF